MTLSIRHDVPTAQRASRPVAVRPPSRPVIRHRVELPEEIWTRLWRILIGLTTIAVAGGGAWIGILLAPHWGKILLTLLTTAALWAVVASSIAFFRDR